jgi:hypothetical protein
MTLPDRPAAIKAARENAHISPPDPRAVAFSDLRLRFFRDWARAIDANDVPAMRKATAALRSLRVSVLLLGPKSVREGRP